MYPSIKGRKIKMGVVGCGRISKNHFEAIKAHGSDLELVGICDVEPARLSEVRAHLDVPAYADLTSMLEKCDADLYALCTPSGLHPRQTIEIAKKQKHIMSEKPMATQWLEGKRMVEECDRNNVRLFVVKQNRYNQTIQMVKRAIEQKRFGRIYMVNINVFWNRPQSYYDQAAWRGTWEFDGGALMNQASHYVDLLDWLIGPVESVHSYAATLGRNIQVEDTAAVTVKWRSGALGSVNVTMLAYNKNFEGSLTILGEKGTVRLGGVAVNEIEHWEFADTQPEDASVKDASYQTTSVYGHGHPFYYKNVIDVLRGTAEPLTCGREGLRSLEVLVAAYTSARDGRKVTLPLDY